MTLKEALGTLTGGSLVAVRVGKGDYILKGSFVIGARASIVSTKLLESEVEYIDIANNGALIVLKERRSEIVEELERSLLRLVHKIEDRKLREEIGQLYNVRNYEEIQAIADHDPNFRALESAGGIKRAVDKLMDALVDNK